MTEGVCILGPTEGLEDDCVRGPVVGGASIGGGATLLPALVIGAGALVSAGSVVTRSVEPGVVVAGNPARVIGRSDAMDCFAGLFDRAYAWEEAVTGDGPGLSGAAGPGDG